MIDNYFYIVIYNVDKKQVFNTMLEIEQWKREANHWGVKLNIVSINRINFNEVIQCFNH